VVREGEFANAENAQGVPDRIRNTWNRIVNGERLTAGMRQEFVSAAEGLANEQMQRQQRVVTQFEEIAKQGGFDPSRIIMDFGANTPAAPPPPGGTTQAPSQPAVKMLRSDPSPLRIQQFEEVFGPGSAQRALGR
jgi:hypothetical protein